jgi:uncharacterized protein YdaU (DUF1376 family)
MSSATASRLFKGPWIPWFHGDFIRATQGWTVTERGVYFLLLGASWEMGPLPDDRRRLAGIVGAQLDEFDDAWKMVRPKFELTEQGLVNRRLEIHRENQAIRSAKARQSVMNRWGKTADKDTFVDTFVDTSVHTNAGTSDDTGDHTKSIRSGYSSELISQISENKEKTIVEAKPSTAVQDVFEHWKAEWKHPNAKLDDKRKKAIHAALKLYPSATLCRAISGFRKSEYHTGKNDHRTVYDRLQLLLRDADQIEKGITLYDQTTSNGGWQ